MKYSFVVFLPLLKFYSFNVPLTFPGRASSPLPWSDTGPLLSPADMTLWPPGRRRTPSPPVTSSSGPHRPRMSPPDPGRCCSTGAQSDSDSYELRRTGH